MESIAGRTSSISFCKKFMSYLFMKFRFIHLIRFRVDNARVFQRVSINLNITIGQAACRLLYGYTRSTLAASCVCWILPIVTCESGDLIKGWGCTADKSNRDSSTAAVSCNKSIMLLLSTTVVLLVLLSRKSRLVFLDVIFSI